jgi:hypothetical protein
MDVKNYLNCRSVGIVMLWISIFSTFGCKEKINEPKPANLIARDTMVLILAEFHLLESSFGVRIFEEKEIANSRNMLKSKIYKDYHVTKERFFDSYNYYAKQTLTIDSIYTDIISEIAKRKAQQIK